MRYTINFDCKTHYVSKDGKIPMLLRVSLNGVHDYLNTGKRIKEAHYDKEKKTVRAGITGFSKISSFIDRQKARIEDIINDFDKKGEMPTISKIKNTYEQETGKVKTKCFYEFVDGHIQWERANTQKSQDTLDNYVDQLNKLKKYRQKLSIHDIDPKFLLAYKFHIITSLGQANNTAYHAMCFLRKYTKILFDDGKISPYPFAKFKVGSPFEVDPEYLEPEELTRLHDLYDSMELLKIIKLAKSKHSKDFNIGERYQAVLRHFLIACYTGLRHSDMETLRKHHIKGKFIVKTLVKGREGRKKTVRIPIRKRLLTLLEINDSDGRLFSTPVMQTSQTNKYLEDIMEIAKINKHVTSHIARHSFSIISLLLGIKIEVVSDILGHSELTTTQRYARVVDRLRDQEMNKWDQLIQEEKMQDSYSEVICPSCENSLLKFEKGLIKLNKLPCTCPYCATSFLFSINGSSEENNGEKMKLIA